MPSPSIRLFRRVVATALLTGAVLAMVPPALGEGVPPTVMAIRPLSAAALRPPSGPAIPAGTELPQKRAIWTRTTRVCAPFWFTMIGLVWNQSDDRPVRAALSWGPGVSGGAIVDADPHDAPDRGSAEDSGIQGTPPVWTGEHRCVRFRLRLPTQGAVRALRVVFLNTSGTARKPSRLITLGDRVARAWSTMTGAWAPSEAEAMTSQPRIITRAEWGANERLRNCGPFYADALKISYIHHTATGNGYGRGRADDIMRGIYAFHTKARGFCDIAYNFLVDRFGRIYEGRYGGMDQPVIGGHAMGFNTGSAGIAAMGNFTHADPPTVMVRALKRLVAWRMDVGHVPPNGWTTMTSGGGPAQKYREGETVALRTVIAHRRTGYTSCPGHLWRLMGKIRRDAAAIGLPKIYNVTRSAPDLVHGMSTVQVTGTISEPLRWFVTVTDINGEIVRRFSGEGTAIDAVWDGQDKLGMPVPDGIYDVTIAAGSDPSAPEARPAAFKVNVATAPPAPRILPIPEPSLSITPTPTPSPTVTAGA